MVMEEEDAAENSAGIAANFVKMKETFMSTWILALGTRGLVQFSLATITKQLFGMFVATGCGTTLCPMQQTKFLQFGTRYLATTRS